MLNVDLHSHSTVSDGTLTPAEVAQRAHAHGVDIWALTDHDEVAGLVEAKNIADTLGIQFIPGVEVSVTWLDRTVHIVGLGVDSSDPLLIEALAELCKGRTQRAQRIGGRLYEMCVEGAYEGDWAY